MGNYIVATDLKKYYAQTRIIDLAEGDSTTETLAAMATATEERVNAAVAAAEAIADGFLSPRFTLPVSPATERLKMACCFVAIWCLYEGRPELTDGNGKNPFQKHYEIHTEWLESVSQDEMGLGGTVTSGETEIFMTSADANEAAGLGEGYIHAGGELDDF